MTLKIVLWIQEEKNGYKVLNKLKKSVFNEVYCELTDISLLFFSCMLQNYRDVNLGKKKSNYK